MSFDFEFKKEHLAAMIPGNDRVDHWYAALVEILPKYGITTERRVAHFVSQCAHESNNFRTLEENLNYREETLLKIFSRYFGPGKRNAAEYAKNPEKIANYVYMDEFRKSKMGNTQPGDGWRFRGRGLKQLTGRDNYTRFGASVGMSAEQAAEYVATEKGAIESACWFWDANKLNSLADGDDVTAMTKRGKISATPVNPQITDAVTQTLREGSKGDLVKRMQAVLGISADGDFGPGTERAVKAWQAKNGLTADGIVGPKTLAAMGIS